MILIDPSKSDKVCRTEEAEAHKNKEHGACGNDSRYMKNSFIGLRIDLGVFQGPIKALESWDVWAGFPCRQTRHMIADHGPEGLHAAVCHLM